MIAEGAQRLPPGQREGPNWMSEEKMNLRMQSRLRDSMKGKGASHKVCTLTENVMNFIKVQPLTSPQVSETRVACFRHKFCTEI